MAAVAMRIVLGSSVIGMVVARAAAATTALPLGTGTACVMMSEAETRAQLGVMRHHAIVCADPGGTVTRMSMAGSVYCNDYQRSFTATRTE